MLNSHARAALLLPLIVLCTPLAGAVRAQTALAKEAPATVAGRVTDGEKGVGGVLVSLIVFESRAEPRTAARATTEADGRYMLTNIAPGRYQIVPMAPTFILPGTYGYPPGKSLHLSAGESVADINFEVAPGGVVTGRVTDEDDKPVVEENVQIVPVDKDKTPPRPNFNPYMFRTDDRGVYRVYGLSPGRYRVSVGLDKEMGAVRAGGSGKYYPRTFYPNATDEAQAKLVEVPAGGEASGIDITLGKPTKTFRAAGRVVSAETGEPVPGTLISASPMNKLSNRLTSFGPRLPSNALGEFQIENLVPGHYSVFASSQEATEWYSDATTFDVADADVDGLEVKVRRGATLSGVVQMEGVRDRALAARLISQVSLVAFREERDGPVMPPVWLPTRLAPDGSFLVNGIRPGKVHLALAGPSNVKGVMLVRVEREGVEQLNGIDIAEGAQVTGTRVVLAYGTAVIRGQVNFVNGTPPQGARAAASTRQLASSGSRPAGHYAEVDARGHFVLEGLAPGEYEIVVQMYSRRGMKEAKQTISVPASGEMNVTLALDLSEGATP